MIQFSCILHYNMSIKYAEDPFNMGMFFDIRPPSLWVHFQTPTHIRAFCTGVAPPGPPGPETYALFQCSLASLVGLEVVRRLYWTGLGSREIDYRPQGSITFGNRN